MKKFIIFAILASLCLSAFFIRLHNFKKSPARTIDEIVYFNLGKQVAVDVTDYNTIPYGRYLESTGRSLPEYFFKPLFKHPPVFSFLVAASIKVFGVSLQSAEYVSLLAGILMIPLIYFLGKLIYNFKVGLLAAILLWMDPVSIICSQKVWMDTTLAFFTVLAVYYFAKALLENRDGFYFLSGFFSGIAVCTKYTGILATISIVIYAAIYQKQLFKNRKFLICLIIPFVLLFFWICWNFQVYGASFFMDLLKVHGVDNSMIKTPKFIFILGILLSISWIAKCFYSKIKYRSSVENLFEKSQNKIIRYILICIAVLFYMAVYQSVLRFFIFKWSPRTSWLTGAYAYSLPIFYFEQLIEFSGFYILAFMGFFIRNTEEGQGAPIVRISALITIIFFIFWRSFQSRYILAALPFLLIMASQMIFVVTEKLMSFRNTFWVKGLCICFALFLFYAAIKTMRINLFVSFTNDMCYF